MISIPEFKTKVIKVVEYEGEKILIRKLGNETFEYIVCINGDFYSTSIRATRNFIQKLLNKPYTDKQFNANVNYVIAMAQTTIDSVKRIEHN